MEQTPGNGTRRHSTAYNIIQRIKAGTKTPISPWLWVYMFHGEFSSQKAHWTQTGRGVRWLLFAKFSRNGFGLFSWVLGPLNTLRVRIKGSLLVLEIWFFTVTLVVCRWSSRKNFSGPKKEVYIYRNIFVLYPINPHFTFSEEIAKLSEVFTSSSSESKTRSSSRRIERTSIRTYYSNADLVTQFNQQSDQQHGGYGETPIRHQREFEKNNFGGGHESNRARSPKSFRENFVGSRESIWNSPIHLNSNNSSRDFRVRSPSLPQIGRSVLR